MGTLTEQVTIITGSWTGIGRQIVLTYAGEGKKVVADFNEAMIDQIVDTFGTVDVLVKNGCVYYTAHGFISGTIILSSKTKECEYGRVCMAK